MNSLFELFIEKTEFPHNKGKQRELGEEEVGECASEPSLYAGDRRRITPRLDSPDLVLLCVGPEVEEHVLAEVGRGTKSNH